MNINTTKFYEYHFVHFIISTLSGLKGTCDQKLEARLLKKENKKLEYLVKDQFDKLCATLSLR